MLTLVALLAVWGGGLDLSLALWCRWSHLCYSQLNFSVRSTTSPPAVRCPTTMTRSTTTLRAASTMDQGCWTWMPSMRWTTITRVSGEEESCIFTRALLEQVQGQADSTPTVAAVAAGAKLLW